jgi:hypothetical protein
MLRLSRLPQEVAWIQGAGGFEFVPTGDALAAVGVGGQTLTPVSLIDGSTW